MPKSGYLTLTLPADAYREIERRADELDMTPAKYVTMVCHVNEPRHYSPGRRGTRRSHSPRTRHNRKEAGV